MPDEADDRPAHGVSWGARRNCTPSAPADPRQDIYLSCEFSGRWLYFGEQTDEYDDYHGPSEDERHDCRAVLASEHASGMMKAFAALYLACCHHNSKRRGTALRTVAALRQVAADHPGTHAAHLAEGAIKRMRPLADNERARAATAAASPAR
ncbi:MAG: hypothetical protein K2W96_12680 [Gemmataceae bacterium]|nr:hypothetical protein [Gemmataceae bacterium]